MSQLNSTNYPNQVPVADDYAPFVRDSDSVLKTATMQQLAELFQSLASLVLTVTVYSANQTLDSEDQFVEANSGGAFNLTLPASSLNTGRRYIVFNKGAGTVTVLPNGSDTINGAASLALAQYESSMLTSDGLGMWSSLKGA
jgi:hypothetical protein